MRNEMKVGLLVVIALFLMIMLIFGVGDVSLFSSGVDYHIIFDNAGSLKKGSPVKKAGVKVGNVKAIDFIDYDGRRMVDVTINVDKNEPLREGDKFYITMTGMLGDYYVNIMSGKLSQDKVKPENAIRGENVAGVDELFSQVQVTLDRVNRVLDDESVEHMKNTMEQVDGLSADLEYVLAESKDDMVITMASLRNTSIHLENMVLSNEASLNTTLANAELVSEDAVVAVDNFREISEKLNNGEGTAGKLLEDEQLYDEMLGTTTETRELIKDVRENPTRYIHISLF